MDRHKLFEIHVENEVIGKLGTLLYSNRSSKDTLADVAQKLTFLLTQIIQSDEESVFEKRN